MKSPHIQGLHFRLARSPVGVLIDSSVVIAAERGQLATDELQQRLAEEIVAFAAITASELLHGAHRADTVSRRQRRLEFVERQEVARTYASLWADLARTGSPIGAHDLLIAATALTRNLTIATRNERESVGSMG